MMKNIYKSKKFNKTIEIPKMTIVVKAIFYDKSKCYQQVLLNECLYKT